jgi:hypothetical protein
MVPHTTSSSRLGAADLLSLAAAPAFAGMALLTSWYGDMGAMCGSGALASLGSALGGMMPMYLLMSVFHLTPWLRLASGQRATAGQR